MRTETRRRTLIARAIACNGGVPTAVIVLATTLACPGAASAWADEPESTAPEAEVPAAGADAAPAFDPFLDALELLADATDPADIVHGLDVLREGFPRSRDALSNAVGARSTKLAIFALRVLGEKGDAGKDLDVVATALHRPSPTVRLAAVMAVRNLGADGFDPLVRLLERETEPNVIKMAVKTLQHWGRKDAVAPIVRSLRRVLDANARSFCFAALEALSGESFGSDVEAWETYVERNALLKQAREQLRVEANARPAARRPHDEP